MNRGVRTELQLSSYERNLLNMCTLHAVKTNRFKKAKKALKYVEPHASNLIIFSYKNITVDALVNRHFGWYINLALSGLLTTYSELNTQLNFSREMQSVLFFSKLNKKVNPEVYYKVQLLIHRLLPFLQAIGMHVWSFIGSPVYYTRKIMH